MRSDGRFLAGAKNLTARPLGFQATWLSQPRTVADFQLIDQTGAPPSLRTNCNASPASYLLIHALSPTSCPTTLVKLSQVQKAAPFPACHGCCS